ncbi:MAG: RnfABCDGE type electron transport complex subunit D [Chitinophagaceae bacterium]|nr:RnfABCDGE type electron transport complex subunit D [Chitinophagaceae bacterium]
MHVNQIFKDARYFQIIFQSIFLCYGLYFLHWNSEYWLYATYFVSCLATQFIGEWLLGNKNIPFLTRYKSGIPSVLISAFGLSLLLKTNVTGVAVFASAFTIASKYIFRINGKHIFNPSALGIVAAIWLTGDAWVSPGQWGSNAVILFAVLSLGFIITTRIQKLDVSLAFLGVFAGLVFIRQIIYLGWPIDHFIQSVSTGSLLIFSFFMITDPKTIPNHTVVRIIWSAAIAAIAFYLAAFKFINAAPIFVLVLAQPLVPLLDRLFKARKFEWAPVSRITPEEKNFLQIVYSRSTM